MTVAAGTLKEVDPLTGVTSLPNALKDLRPSPLKVGSGVCSRSPPSRELVLKIGLV